MEMKSKNIPAILIIVVSLSVFVSMALAAQEAKDRFTLKAPNGVAFSEFIEWMGIRPVFI
jgi:hypothetical protein